MNQNLRSKLDLINISLEKKSWYVSENYLSEDLCNQISKAYINAKDSKKFLKSKIGKGYNKTQVVDIRNGLRCWIDDWKENEAIAELHNELSEMMDSLNTFFRLSIKRFESEFSLYNKGGFYHRHLDQHYKARHRLISCCFYLNDCSNGGELVIYKKHTQTVIDQIVKPKKGSIAIFISGDIFHEVKLVQTPRYSITNWFRDDEIIPFI